MRMELGQYPYSLWAYADADPDLIYAVVKAMHKGYDIFKGMHRVLPQWNLQQAVKDPSPVPYHEGAIKYFREVGLWGPEMDEWQATQVKASQARIAAFKK